MIEGSKMHNHYRIRQGIAPCAFYHELLQDELLLMCLQWLVTEIKFHPEEDSYHFGFRCKYLKLNENYKTLTRIL